MSTEKKHPSRTRQTGYTESRVCPAPARGLTSDRGGSSQGVLAGCAELARLKVALQAKVRGQPALHQWTRRHLLGTRRPSSFIPSKHVFI